MADAFTKCWKWVLALPRQRERRAPSATTRTNVTSRQTAAGEAAETFDAPGYTTPVSFACMMDMNQDSTVTDADLAALERDYLYARVTETNAVYDLNGNGQIEIGDIQRMAAYLDAACAE